ncbi:putative adhesin [Pseudomonas chlororaphis]|nr:hypothetical protein [Pseudomonas chlororaphis]
MPKQATALGEHFYLFQRNPGQAGKKLVITAHGEYLPGMHTRVPENTKLVYYGPDGKTLQDPGLGNVVNGFVQVYEEKAPQSRVRNYLLSKYGDDSYEAIERQVMGAGVDVLTVRNRKAPRLYLKNSMISLNDVLIELAKNAIQYDEIHCVICRSPTLNPFAGNFLAPEVPPIEWPEPKASPPINTPRQTAPARLDENLLDSLNGYEFATMRPRTVQPESSQAPQVQAAKTADARKVWFESP